MSEKRYLNALKTGQKLYWYEIREVLGQGGFSTTYLAQDINLNLEVAIKEYLPVDLAIRTKNGVISPISDEHYEKYYWGLERFLGETRTLSQFKHPNIVQVRGVFEANNTAYMVMEYELGESFQNILNQRKTVSENDLKKIVTPIVDAMRVVHAAGFIHRDIKPANIFLRVDGDPILLDFGSARQSSIQDNESLTSIFSRGYAPIEQYHSSEETEGEGIWTDIYSLGATMYRAISGIRPTDAIDRSAAIAQMKGDIYVSITEVASNEYSDDLLKAIDYAMQFRQQDRPQTISEWIATFYRREISKQNQFSIDTSSIEQQTLADSEAGDANAQSQLAVMYCNGQGVERNDTKAFYWFKKAAEQGHLNSQYNLALMYAKGRGVRKNYHVALTWYKAAANQGDITSQYTLGVMYSKGIGTEQDHEQAYTWFLKPAEQGHTNAEYKIAEMFSKGIGIVTDHKAAYKWYKKASIKGHTLAQMKLAYMYCNGQGVERNNTEAFYWFRKAAEREHPRAQYNLGVFYARGRGINKNIDEAKKWYGLAAAQGDERAEKALALINYN